MGGWIQGEYLGEGMPVCRLEPIFATDASWVTVFYQKVAVNGKVGVGAEIFNSIGEVIEVHATHINALKVLSSYRSRSSHTNASNFKVSSSSLGFREIR